MRGLAAGAVALGILATDLSAQARRLTPVSSPPGARTSVHVTPGAGRLTPAQRAQEFRDRIPGWVADAAVLAAPVELNPRRPNHEDRIYASLFGGDARFAPGVSPQNGTWILDRDDGTPHGGGILLVEAKPGLLKKTALVDCLVRTEPPPGVKAQLRVTGAGFVQQVTLAPGTTVHVTAPLEPAPLTSGKPGVRLETVAAASEVSVFWCEVTALH